ncbi:MAG: hypothetical protein A3C15_03070 [Candidatus Magasanikbacteria bacterium RIFCSPHIGHO2_02_FULL_50_9b]|uniref:Probable endonuclease 4 n=1 Tax=Candidatus Magasanikbacteria bacterium RIFCSPHIGHO2_02_FULL_50_9b TaxID=1798682 RepID=A0A1F6M905_9BACT|nr:MAG: hypothetical protein A3C15_03070 [Candidatus Magasanikbacteria bacterium RIFCSPHIGHO2_02_FULL_50_9b]
MLIGAHVSAAGGVQNAPANAHEFGCECFQFFSRSPQGGVAPKLTPEIVAAFLDNCKKYNQREWVIHAPYYINFASDKEFLRKRSAAIIREELERGSLLKAAYLMFHPGSAAVVGRAEGIKLTIEGCRRLLDGYDGHTELLLEISAGAGAIIGDTFEEVAEILRGVGEKMNVCFDTQHAFGSGYDLRDADAVHDTFSKFDKLIGLKRLKMSHCNDSKIELGGHKDRHEHIGDGKIGKKGFAEIVAHPKLKHVNLYCETEYDKVVGDIKIMKKLRDAAAI